MSTNFSRSQAVHSYPAQASFWLQWIKEHPDPTMLPRDFLGAQQTCPTAVQRTCVEAAAFDRARSITKGDPTLGQILLTAVLALVAARATDSPEICVVSGGGPGMTQVLPLSVTVERASSFRSLLSATRAAHLRAAEHADVPVEYLFGQERTAPGDFSVTTGSVDQGPAADGTFGCTLRFRLDLQGEPMLELAYRADLFDTPTARRLAESYTRILAAVTENPDAAVGPLLDADEQEQAVIARLNGTGTTFPDGATLHSFLERQAARMPDQVAIKDDGTTYGELNRRANRLAHRLRQLGVGPGDLVGVCLPRSPRMLTALYAVLKAGGAYLPIDPALPAARIDYLTEHSGSRIVLGTAATRPAVAQAPQFVDLDDEMSFAGPDVNPERGAGPEDPCYVIYTSGSTGRPKGVVVEHRAIVNRLCWMQRAYPLGPDDVILHKTPFTFDVSVWEIFWWSFAGAAVCTLESGHEREPERISERTAEHGVTTMHFVPSMLQAFLRYTEASSSAGRLASLRRVFASGEALPTTSAQSFASVAPGVDLINLYGPTEAAIDVSYFDCAKLDPSKPLSIGRPIDNIQLYVLTRAGTQAPVGTPGELHIAGAGLARGYLNAPELTAERFVVGTVPGSGRMYRTGDLARRLPGGDIEYLGRLDTQVKIRGYRIELGEIEHVAARSAGVADCAVLPLDDESGDPYLCAYVIPADGYDEGVLRATLAAELPAYMVPRYVMTIDAIPTNHNGKRDASRLPEPVRGNTGRGRVAPRNEGEQRLAAIWARALGVTEISVHDDFFALGGDSIKGVVVLAALREAGLELSFQELFAHPTVAEAAALVRPVTGDARRAEGSEGGAGGPFGLLPAEDRPLLPETAVDAYPLSMLQAGLLYEVAGAESAGLYHDVACYRVPRLVDVTAFRAALAEVVERHPLFRTSFHPEGFSVPLQIVHASVPLPFDVVDLSGLSEHDQDAVLAAFPSEALERGFVPGEPDLVRVTLHLLGDRGYQYSLSYHAAALDGWSVSTLHRDLFAAYLADQEAIPANAASDGPTYQDFLQLEQEAVASQEQADFWTELLEGAQSTRVPRLSAASSEAAKNGLVMHDVTLPDEVSAGVLMTAAELRVPVKSVLLAAHVAVMEFMAGTDDVLVGYEHSGRPEVVGGDQLAGLFLNTLPFRVRTGGLSWAGLVRRVYETEVELLPYRRFPMGEMKRRLGARNALFESVFNFTHFHVLKDLVQRYGFELVRSDISSRTEFPFRAEFWQDALTDEVGLALHCHEGELAGEQIDHIAGYYVRALRLINEYTHESHTAGTLLSGQELALLTEEFAGPRRELPPGTLLDLFARQVAEGPERPAVSQGTELLTYRELDEISERVATFLRQSGVGHGDVVAVPMDRGLPWAVSFLAILKAGAIYLPQDPSDPPERLAVMYRRSGCRHALVHGSYAGKLVAALAAGADTNGTAAPVLLDYGDACRTAAEADPAGGPGPEDSAYIIFTSGSTGEPKGALIHHRGMLNHLLAKCADLNLVSTDRIAQVATQCFDISVWQLVVPWLVGGRSVIFGHELVSDLPAFLAAVRQEGITVLEVVPSYLDALLSETDRVPVELPALRYTLVTGETMPPSLTRRWFARYGVPLVNAYGPTEASDDVTHHVTTGPVVGDRVPVGRAVLNTRLYVVGPDGRILPIGSYGEILVTGAGVGRGYVNDPERTAAAFEPNTYDDASDLLYRTGDVGRWLPSGELDCAGRVDHQVKVRGHRIELTEIEGALSRIDGIEHAVVLVRAVGGEKLLAAFHTGDADLDLAHIREELTASLPAYMRPDLAVRLTAFPLTRNGKVDRAALERLEVEDSVGGHREPPADALEAEVLRTFAEVLGLAADVLGVTDNFFDRGGHSLAAMRVVSQLDGQATLRDMVALPSARGLAARIREAAPQRRPLLTDLTEAAGMTADPGAPTVVCVPYAGGGAVSYLPLARALHAAGRPIRLLGVDLPGRSRNDVRLPVPALQLAQELAEEIARAVAGKLVLLGHSAGAGLALATGFALREMGRGPDQLIVVAAVLPSLEPADYRADEAAAMTDVDVLSWLADRIGLREAEQLSPGARADVARAFRYDVVTAQHSYAAVLSDADEPGLDCPVTVLLAEDDPLTAGRTADVERWARFGSDLRVAWADSGAHYLNASRPDFLAGQINQSVIGGGK
ncbi:amino acid adenylation domain-containing protein [Streptomyces diacarni]|uniref:amino acid adenylation domain-containing protein n=1 Tax=Streptomyces diacarni TaxID=2800381 RepID=UPI0033F81EE6